MPVIGTGPAAGPYTHYTSRRIPLLGPKPPGGGHLINKSVGQLTLDCLERIEKLLQRLLELKEPEKRTHPQQVSKSDRKGR